MQPMQWDEWANSLMEAVIGRDEELAARLSSESCPDGRFSEWAFYRFDIDANRFRRLFPDPENDGISFDDCRKRLEKGEVVVDNEVSGSTGEGSEEDAASAIAIPLVYRSQLQGVLRGVAAEGGRCRESLCSTPLLQELRPRLRFLSQAWFLVGLLDEKEQLVYLDRLTRLHNSEYLVHFLENELARCARHDRQLAIVFLDVDWFKRVNDRHGHLMGSQVLRELAVLLRGCVRESDALVRYGGDEFVAVLTETGEEGARELAERLRSEVEGHVFGQGQRQDVRFTISLGISVYPEHGRQASDLIHQADLAMYVAKHSQKNCVKVAVP